MKVAIIDLGTNTCRLFLAEVAAAGGEVYPAAHVSTVARVTMVVRLGQGVGRTGRLDVDAMARTRACIAEYAPRLEAYGPARRLLVATSVLRDAADGREFLEALERDFGLPWRVVSGEEEGALAFRGGTAWLTAEAMAAGDAAKAVARASKRAAVGPAGSAPPGWVPPPDPLLLVDIGGGSTEFVIGSAGQTPTSVRSLDVGVVRLTERFFAHDPPTAAQVAALSAHVTAAIEADVPAGQRAAVGGAIGVAGSFTTLVANKLGMREYDARRVQGHVLSRTDIETAARLFARLTSAERGRLPGIQPGREDVILAGALIALAAVDAFGLTEIRCSEADLLEGAALALADGSLQAG